LASFDVGQEPLRRGALQRAARNATVVIAVVDENPALRLLAGDVRLARLALGIEAVELHVQAFLGGMGAGGLGCLRSRA
jgi:hypothetical protein